MDLQQCQLLFAAGLQSSTTFSPSPSRADSPPGFMLSAWGDHLRRSHCGRIWKDPRRGMVRIHFVPRAATRPFSGGRSLRVFSPASLKGGSTWQLSLFNEGFPREMHLDSCTLSPHGDSHAFASRRPRQFGPPCWKPLSSPFRIVRYGAWPHMSLAPFCVLLPHGL